MVLSRPSASRSVWTTLDLLGELYSFCYSAVFAGLLKAMSSRKHLDPRVTLPGVASLELPPALLQCGSPAIRYAAAWTGSLGLIVFGNL